MQIIHKIDDFLYTIFPNIKKGDEQYLINVKQEYYTYGPYRPKVTIKDNWIKIDIDIPTLVSQDGDSKKVFALCEDGINSEAKLILKNPESKNATISEYHRIKGQILSNERDQEEAIICLIDALLRYSKNGWALLMMVNICVKLKDDVSTAMKYYDQALVANLNDHIRVNNIGAKLIQQGKLEKEKKYFYEALKINDKYPNNHFALGIIDEIEADSLSAFYCTIQAIKLNKNKDVLYQNAVRQYFEMATQGTQGYRPNKDDYLISSIKSKTFSGYHILAYYYVSWALAIPEILSQLQLPYSDEYKLSFNHV